MKSCNYTIAAGILIATIMAFGAKVHAKVLLEISQDAEVHDISSKEITDFKAGEVKSVEFKNPVWVRATSGLPVLIVPILPGVDNLKLDVPAVENYLTKENQVKIDDHLSKILQEFTEIQRMVQRKQIKDADVKLTALMTEYPSVKFLQFLRASVYVLQGQKDSARTALKIGLAAHPNYAEGKALLQTLGDKP